MNLYSWGHVFKSQNWGQENKIELLPCILFSNVSVTSLMYHGNVFWIFSVHRNIEIYFWIKKNLEWHKIKLKTKKKKVLPQKSYQYLVHPPLDLTCFSCLDMNSTSFLKYCDCLRSQKTNFLYSSYYIFWFFLPSWRGTAHIHCDTRIFYAPFDELRWKWLSIVPWTPLTNNLQMSNSSISVSECCHIFHRGQNYSIHTWRRIEDPATKIIKHSLNNIYPW